MKRYTSTNVRFTDVWFTPRIELLKSSFVLDAQTNGKWKILGVKGGWKMQTNEKKEKLFDFSCTLVWKTIDRVKPHKINNTGSLLKATASEYRPCNWLQTRLSGLSPRSTFQRGPHRLPSPLLSVLQRLSRKSTLTLKKHQFALGPVSVCDAQHSRSICWGSWRCPGRMPSAWTCS